MGPDPHTEGATDRRWLLEEGLYTPYREEAVKGTVVAFIAGGLLGLFLGYRIGTAVGLIRLARAELRQRRSIIRQFRG